jgi:hypothetical protein
MSHDPKWSALGTPTQILGAIGLGALILDGLNIAGLGSGLLEWIIVAPILVWTFVLGFRLSIFRPSSPMEVFRK